MTSDFSLRYASSVLEYLSRSSQKVGAEFVDESLAIARLNSWIRYCEQLEEREMRDC